GCYLWDYGQKRPMPLELVQEQCAAGLEWIRQGRVEGVILLASCICDLELEAVGWARGLGGPGGGQAPGGSGGRTMADDRAAALAPCRTEGTGGEGRER